MHLNSIKPVRSAAHMSVGLLLGMGVATCQVKWMQRDTARRRNCRAEFCDLIEKTEMQIAPAQKCKLDGLISRSKGQ